MEATTKDLRLHTKELLSATKRGEEVVITFRGKPTAKLVPLSTDIDEVEKSSTVRRRNPGFGMWANESTTVDEQVRSLRQKRNFD